MQFMFYFNSDLDLITYIIKISVADPKRLDPDPDPVKETERVRIRNSELLYMHHLFPRR